MKRLFEKYQVWWRDHLPQLWVILCIVVAIAIRFTQLSLYEGIQILLMVTLVLVTWWYAMSAKQQAKASVEIAEETRQSRFASFQPIIVTGRCPASVEPPDKKVVIEQTVISHRTWVYNVGPGPALNIRLFRKEPSRRNPIGTDSGPEIKALGPDEAYELSLDKFGYKWTGQHDLTVEYEDVLGNKWCSGLELTYDPQGDCYNIIKLFYEKMS